MGFDLEQTGILAKKAAFSLQAFSTSKKNEGLLAVADALEQNSAPIIEENEKDLENAKQRGTSDAMIDRLRLDEKRIADMALGVRSVCDLPDPVGEVLSETVRPNGLRMHSRYVSRREMPLYCVAGAMRYIQTRLS